MVRVLLQDNPVRGPLNVQGVLADEVAKPPSWKQVSYRVSRARRLGITRLRVGEPVARWMKPRQARKEMMQRALDLRKQFEGTLGQAQFSRLLRYRGVVLSTDNQSSIMQDYPHVSPSASALDVVLPADKKAAIKELLYQYGDRYTDLEIWSTLPGRLEFTSEVVGELRRITEVELIDNKAKRTARRKLHPWAALLVA